MVHNRMNHKEETAKRSKVTLQCKKYNCESTFDNQEKLKEHTKKQHEEPEIIQTLETESPSSSPPRKKLEKQIEENNSDMLDLDNMEIKIEKELNINFLLERRIKELEEIKLKESSRIQELEIMVTSLLEEKAKDEEFKLTLKRNIEELKAQSTFKIPKHLSGVHEAHLQKLRGFKMIYKTLGNGRCLENSTAVHIYENEDEGINVKSKVNNHIADNWENFYESKVGLPYKETAGVGNDAKPIEKKTAKDMIEFLRSRESLSVFSNTQELLAIASLFNIKIHIFTYEGKDGSWSEIGPDPQLTSSPELNGKWAPDMFLYHSKNTHFDLLVKDDSRLAAMGLLGKRPVIIPLEKPVNVSVDVTTDDWKTVKPKNQKQKRDNTADEKLLTDDVIEENDSHKDLDEMEEENTLLRGKNSGQRRTDPQTYAESLKQTQKCFKCPHCAKELESQGLLDAHTNTHQSDSYDCKKCHSEFQTSENLEMHVKKEHDKCDEWTCNDCAFQANTSTELIKHLKLSTHQPSPNVGDKKKLFKDYKQCYTCNLEVDGYWNLMNHRKETHPSNKKCRNFPGGKCTFGIKCWYVHAEELMDVDESFEEPRHKCYVCNDDFKTKDELKKHKKSKHPVNVQACENFLLDKCDRNEAQCWYRHEPHTSNTQPKSRPNPQPKSKPSVDQHQNQDFCEAPEDPLPPDQMQKMMEAVTNLCLKVEMMEKRFKDLMN